MSELSDILQARLKEKGLTKYAIAKALSEIDGKGKPVTSYTTKVNKIMDSPESRVFEGLKQVIELLDGEVIIRWRTTTEHKLQ